jgi:hypothetical protein
LSTVFALVSLDRQIDAPDGSIRIAPSGSAILITMTRPGPVGRAWGRIRQGGLGLVAGPRFARRLALSHSVDDFADAFINLALVGSLFFSVSIDASRSRILLYLVLTAAPLAVAAPLVGPALDRSRIGFRAAIVGSQLLRGVVSLALIGALLSLALYPLAFVVLISRKVYGLAKTALLTRMTDDRAEFLSADAHITRLGTAVGGLGVVTASVLLARESVTVMLLIAALLLVVASLISMGLPKPRSPALQFVSLPRLSDVVPAPVWWATVAVTAIRAAAGALTYLLAFAIKRGGDRWIFAAGLLVAGFGALVATFAAPRLHRRLEPDGVLVLAILVPGFVTAVGVVTIGNLGVLAIAFAIGLGNGIASRSIAVLQSSVPTLTRGRVIARSELVFQLATLIGASLAVGLAASPRPGFAVTSVVLLAGGVIYAHRNRRSLREQASRLMLGEQAPATDRSLPRALLIEAERLASLGAYRMAIVVADDAVQIALRRARTADARAAARWSELKGSIATVKASDDQPESELAVAVLSAAEEVVDEYAAPMRWTRLASRRRE